MRNNLQLIITQLNTTKTAMFDQEFNIISQEISFDSFDNLFYDSPNIPLFQNDTSQWSLSNRSDQTFEEMIQQSQSQQPNQQETSSSQSTQSTQDRDIHGPTSSSDSSSYVQADDESYQIKKSKKIKKVSKKDEKKPTPKAKKAEKSQKKDSDCNNFGKLLIGTVVDSIMKIGQTVYCNSVKIHCFDQQFLVNLNDLSINLKLVLKIIEALKKTAEKIPRKNGDRKKLNPIFNSKDIQYKDMQELIQLGLSQNELQTHVEFAKHVLREQLIFLFSQQKWIKDHSNTKKFKTQVPKKRQNYQKYLQNVKESLKAEKGFSKRFDRKYETQNQNQEE